MYKTVLFDLDGTLTDSGEGIINCVIYALERFGLPIPPKESLRYFVGPPLHESFIKQGVPAEQAEEAVAATEVREETLPAETETLPLERVPEETEGFLTAENSGYDAIPRYYQTDYPYIKFGNGTMATSGCSVTCLAMVASYLTDQEYTPPQMAYHFGSYGKTNIERLDHGIAQMQLPYERTENIQDVLQALRNGKVAIVMMDDESFFTTEQHFIVLAGMTEDGKFIVNDPMETNYKDGDLHIKDGYDNGFADFYLTQGFSGGWIFDKASYPADHFVFDASMPEQKENRYNGYTLTGEDIYTLACFVWAEARNEPPIVQQAVAEVVLNRMMEEKYPNTVREVIMQTEFYRAAPAMARISEPEQDQYIAVDAAMYGPYILPEDVVFFATFKTNENVWGQIGGHIFCYEY